MRVLVDIASVAKKALLAGKDTVEGYYEIHPETGEEVLINSANYGLGNLINSLKTFLTATGASPKDMVFVFDGDGGTATRKNIYPDYKSGRKKPNGFYREYNNMMSMFNDQVLNLGAQTARFDGVEADDLIAWFCKTLKKEKLLIWSNDYDLLALVDEGHVDVYCQGSLNPKPYGDFPHGFIDVYKATVGDSSDKIPGAKGFGPKSFESVYATFGDNGLNVLRYLIQTQSLANLIEDVPKVTALQKLIDYAPDVETSLKLATFQTSSIELKRIVWGHGICHPNFKVHPALQEWAQKVVGVTTHNFQEVSENIKRLVENHTLVSLDIETSTPEESDEWLYEIKGKEGAGVDTYGSTLTGLSLTLGSNFQYTYYFSVDHSYTDNISIKDLKELIKYIDERCRFIIQNVNFELPVLHNEFGWFLRDVDDTKLMASYVDENSSSGLKFNSERWLNYKQATYEETVTSSSGRIRKMNELSLSEVLSYGSDDTICTAALYQWYRLYMCLEDVWEVYRKVEIGAAYWVAQAFLDGVKIDRVALASMIARDERDKLKYEAELHEYLTNKGWEGSVFNPATPENFSDPSWIKYAFNIVTGTELATRVRKFNRLIEEVDSQGAPELASLLSDGNLNNLNFYVKSKFSGRPIFNVGSPKQMQQLMYETMGLEIRIRNKPTDNMKAKSLEGTPQTDDVAINSALHYDVPDPNDPRHKVLKALLKIKTYNTREGLYYKTYPKLPHWKDDKIRSSLNQCSTVTRRYSSSQPNLQQLAKGAGDFRNIFIPHHKKAMIVSLDFSAQELRIIADYSKDKNMLDCYMGENRKDLHSLTAAGIAQMSYEEFKTILDDESHPKHKWAKDLRKLAKTVNFGSEYGAMAPKMAQTLMVTEEQAQQYLDAKFEAFKDSESWKKDVIKEAKLLGYSTTKLGARRHLPDLLSQNSWKAAKAERQAVNFKVQGSGAEMTKLAMGRIWNSGLRNRYDIRFFAPIHDEMVFSIALDDMPQAITDIHKLMTANYADMVVPIESSVSFGWNFGEQHEMGDVEITPEEVSRQLHLFMNKETA